MTKSDYHAMRRERHRLIQKIANLRVHADMADSRLVVQMDSQAEHVIRLRTRITAIRQEMPACRDPKGFRAMHSYWMLRRIITLADARADASRAGDDDKFIRMHKLYNAHLKRGRI